MVVAVIGSRTFTDRPRLFRDLDALREKLGEFTLISGGAEGGDTFDREWARSRNVPFEEFLPDYAKHGGVRGRAEMIRNRQIANTTDLLIAYWNRKSRGTKATIEMAVKAGKQVYVHHFEESP